MLCRRTIVGITMPGKVPGLLACLKLRVANKIPNSEANKRSDWIDDSRHCYGFAPIQFEFELHFDLLLRLDRSRSVEHP